MNAKVWRVELVFQKSVSTYIEADTIPEARRIAKEAAGDMDVMDAPGSDFDACEVRVGQYPRELRVVAAEDEEAFVWRAGDKWVLCDSVGERLEELSASKAGHADG